MPEHPAIASVKVLPGSAGFGSLYPVGRAWLSVSAGSSNSADAGYVWSAWCAVNEGAAAGIRDVTAEVWEAIQAVRGTEPSQ